MTKIEREKTRTQSTFERVMGGTEKGMLGGHYKVLGRNKDREFPGGPSKVLWEEQGRACWGLGGPGK